MENRGKEKFYQTNGFRALVAAFLAVVLLVDGTVGNLAILVAAEQEGAHQEVMALESQAEPEAQAEPNAQAGPEADPEADPEPMAAGDAGADTKQDSFAFRIKTHLMAQNLLCLQKSMLR